MNHRISLLAIGLSLFVVTACAAQTLKPRLEKKQDKQAKPLTEDEQSQLANNVYELTKSAKTASQF